MINTFELTYFILILARMSGCVLFNPIFGRGNLPVMFKTGMTIILAMTIYGLLPNDGTIIIRNLLEYMVLILKEIFIGYVIGFIINIFFSIIAVGGEIIDMQIGMSMSKMYDPKSNISVGVSGNFLNLFMMFLFFSAGGHMTLIQIFITSCKVIGIGNIVYSSDLFFQMTYLFQTILIYSVKLSMPILAVEIIAESGIGLMMKAIPQIQVFTINIQMKIIIGILLMLILVPPFSSMIERILVVMFETIQKNLSILA